MNRKHFEAIAAMMKEHCLSLVEDERDVGHDTLWHIVRSELADICADANPRFDRKRFVNACSPKEPQRRLMDCPRCGGPTSVSGENCGEC